MFVFKALSVKLQQESEHGLIQGIATNVLKKTKY